MTDRETIARDKAAHQRLALNSRNGTAIPGLFFYRQPGGCVEASVQDEHDVDIIHFCEDAEARTFLREFEQFITDTSEVVDLPPSPTAQLDEDRDRDQLLVDSDISDKDILDACDAFHANTAPTPDVALAARYPVEVVMAKMDQMADRDLIEYGVSLRTAWVIR